MHTATVKRWLLNLTLVVSLIVSPFGLAETTSSSLATEFDVNKHSLTDYLISEKLDGVNAYWNGEYFLSRGGQRLNAPKWFTQNLPAQHLEGELWGGRGSFDATSGLVRRKNNPEAWHSMRFMVFELPQASGLFSERYKYLQILERQFGNQYWGLIPQRSAPITLVSLRQQLLALDAAGGEGFMLKRKNSFYSSGRADDLFKVKLQHDAEAVVLEHHEGKGRLEGLMGSISVQMPSGITFKIGSGFSDEQRRKPPAIGATVRYKFSGLTKNGKPRFPVFWRIRNKELQLI